MVIIRIPLLILPALFLASCVPKPKPQWLMPTPQLFRDGKVKPFVHLHESNRTTSLAVHYATNRNPLGDHYGNSPTGQLRFGTATMGIGRPGETWSSLATASTTDPRPEPIGIRIESHTETAQQSDRSAMLAWARDIDRDLHKKETRDIIIYVHGAKVGFLHSCAFAAELDHFAGRDFSPVAFDWPTHQEIFAYLFRVDLHNAAPSSKRLSEMVKLLAEGTSARRIHIVSWSAGARVLSRAMEELGGENPAALRSSYRIGTVVFAAGDVPENLFIQRLPAIHGLCDKVLVYVSDGDKALQWASRAMGGGRRLGLAPEKMTPEEKDTLSRMHRLEVVDTSYGKETRGFDITGHRYWFQHPWVNSDLLLSLRTQASPGRRGLKTSPIKGVWYFGKDYPDRIGAIGKRLTTGEW